MLQFGKVIRMLYTSEYQAYFAGVLQHRKLGGFFPGSPHFSNRHRACA